MNATTQAARTQGNLIVHETPHSIQLSDRRGNLIADVDYVPHAEIFEIDRATAAANARRLADCWNGYDELRTAVEEIICGHCHDMIGIPPSTKCDFCRPVREAIAKSTS